jgi:preprotein translocase subunit SecY
MTSGLARRIAITLGALLLFRAGSHIPLPGIDPGVWTELFRSNAGGVLGAANTLTGGALARLSVFSLGIVPFVSAAILVQFASLLVPPWRVLHESGEGGRQRTDRWTLGLTAFIALIQSYGIAGGLADINGLVAQPGSLFTLTTVLTLTGGVFVVVWLCGQITARGIGNGIALILCVGIVTKLPADVLGVVDLGQRGIFSTGQLAGFAAMALALVAIVAVIERARRHEPVTFAGQPAQMSFKLNGAGIIPPVIAAWVLAAPVIAATILDAPDIVRVLTPGEPVYLACYAVLLLFGVFFYTALVLDPNGMAEKLQRLGGAIPQVAPGEATAAHLDSVISRITLTGAVYFVMICLIPELLILWAQVPFYLGGTSLLVLVCTVLDVEKQVREFTHVRVGG